MRINLICAGANRPRRGALVVQAQLLADGHQVQLYDRIPGSSPTPMLDFFGTPDAWFVSVLGHRDWWELPQLMDQISGDGAPVVIGGQSADLMIDWADAFCDILATGDFHSEGRSALYDRVSVSGTGVVNMGWAPVPPPVTRDRTTTIIYLASGCRRGCPYCRITSSRPYAEISLNDAIDALRGVKTGSVNLYSPDGGHRYMPELLAACRELGLTASNTDYHPRAALRMIDDIRPNLPLHLGVEGSSERLRAEIGRKLSNDEITRLQRGRRAHLYLLCGLPGETDDDWAEMHEQMALAASFGPQWYTVTPVLPVPGTKWSGLCGRLTDSQIDTMAALRVHGSGLYDQTGNTTLVSMPKGRELHECEVATVRSKNTAVFLRKLNNNPKQWRAAVEAAGENADSLLLAQHPHAPGDRG